MASRKISALAAAGLFLLAASFPFAAQATLYGVMYDRSLQSELLGRINTTTAAIDYTAGSGLGACCRVNGSLVAADNITSTVYMVTPDPLASAAWRLHRFSLTSGVATTLNLPAAERVAAIVRRESPATLFGLSDAGSGLRLVTISDLGAVTAVGPAIADCCGVRVGVAALSADASRIAFVARQKSDAVGVLRLFVLDSTSGAVVTNAVLARSPDLLYSTSGSTFFASYHDAGTQRIGQVNSDGSLTPIGSGLANCCVRLAGVGARSGSALRLVAQTLGSPGLSLYNVDIVSGAFTAVGTLSPRYVHHALIESPVVLINDVIFRDGFQSVATSASPTPEAVPSEEVKRSGIDAGALREAATQTGAHAAAATMADLADPSSVANPEGIAVTPIPLGGPLVSGLLIGLILLVVALSGRRRLR
jgi:hypothetical protein